MISHVEVGLCLFRETATENLVYASIVDFGEVPLRKMKLDGTVNCFVLELLQQFSEARPEVFLGFLCLIENKDRGVILHRGPCRRIRLFRIRA